MPKKSLLKLMDSELKISSAYGEGTTTRFTVTLPVVDAKTPARTASGDDTAAAASAPPAAQETSREAMEALLSSRVKTYGAPKILLVEDSLTMQMLIKAIFQNLDIPLALAEHGGEALALVQEQAFDIVLMDLQMPVMGGVEAITRIRSSIASASLPIVVLSATVQDSEIAAALDAGGDDFLGKPIDIEDLLRVLLRFWRPADTHR